MGQIRVNDRHGSLLGSISLSELGGVLQEERKRLEKLERHSRRALRLAAGGCAALQVGNYDPMVAKSQLEAVILVLEDLPLDK